MIFGRWALEDEPDKTKARNGNLKKFMAQKARKKIIIRMREGSTNCVITVEKCPLAMVIWKSMWTLGRAALEEYMGRSNIRVS